MTKRYRHPCSHVRRVWEDTDMQVAEFLLNRDLCKGLIMMRLICWEHDSVDKARKGLDPVSWGLSYYDVWIQLGSGYLPSLHTRRDLRWCLQSFSENPNPPPSCGARVAAAAFLTCWWVQPMPISQPKGWKRWWIWWTKQVKDSGWQVIVTCYEIICRVVSVVSLAILNFDLSEQSLILSGRVCLQGQWPLNELHTSHTQNANISLSHTKNVGQHPKWDRAMIIRLEGRKRINRTTSKMTSNQDTAGTAAACGSDSCISSAFGGIWFPPSTSSHDLSPHQKGRTSDLGILLNLSALKSKTTWSNAPRDSWMT